MLARLLGATLAAALMMLFATAAFAQRRLAYVVGNNRYDHVPLLRNAEKDADSIASLLRQVGFDEVIPERNLSYAALNDGLRSFSSKISEGDTALFFFAGHGYNDGAQNLLMPTDIQRFSRDQVRGIRNQSLSVERVINTLQSRGARFAIVIIDTCRRNPFEASNGFDGSLQIIIRAPLPIPSGVRTESFEFYAAGPQQQALDRLGEDDPVPNSVFTRVLLKHLVAPPRPLEQIAKNVRAEVQRLVSQGDPRRVQTPVYVNNITDDFFLTPPAPQGGRTQPPGPRRIPPTGAEAAQQCDRLAAAPDDEQRPRDLPGVRREFIDAVPAIEACETGLRTAPGNVRLQFQLARAYWANMEEDKARAAFEAAAQGGYAAAETALVEMVYRENADGEQDYSEEAAGHLRRAMSRNARAETFLGLMTIRGQAPPYYPSGSDLAYDAGIRHLRRAYGRQDPEAAFWLGIMSYRGRGGMPKDYRLAERYFKTAAETGHRRAILHLGSLYRDWTNAPEHLTTAKRYWEMAARLGSGQATENLAQYYELGWGGAPDRQKACELYEKAGEMGYATSWAKFVAQCPAFARQRRTDLMPLGGRSAGALAPDGLVR
ncbi:caspase family protein [Methylobacterium oryzisoli]|uniref:caspase family protein n=1 Tax=Methylobacterium oryzisoli TaxID=3385502 RepID=UPI003892292E